MAAIELRLVNDGDYLTENLHKPTQAVTVRLDHVLPLFLDAIATNRQWLQDFSDETLEISADLYDVLLAYQRLRQAG